jgi:hypothetical protein
MNVLLLLTPMACCVVWYFKWGPVAFSLVRYRHCQCMLRGCAV